MVSFGQVLRVFDVSTANSKPTCIASMRGHTAAVVAVVAAGNMRVVSGSRDGTVRVWDVIDGSCLRTVDVGQKVVDLCRVTEEGVLCLCEKRVMMVSLSRQDTKKMRRVFPDCVFHGCGGRIASSVNGNIVAVIDRNKLELTSVAKPANPVVVVKHLSQLTVVAVSKDGSKLAVGDERGSIFVYPNPSSLFPDSNKTVRLERCQTASATLHWHSSAVGALAFSSDANVLLSGGAEAALVSWKMTRSRLGDRTILPRLGSAILGISISGDECKYVLTHVDNSVRVLDQAGGTISATIRGIAVSVRGTDKLDCSTAAVARNSTDVLDILHVTKDHSVDGHVFVSGNGGDVQVLDVLGAGHIYSINVVPRNAVHQPLNPGSKQKSQGVAKVIAMKRSASVKKAVSVDEQRLAADSNDESGVVETMTSLRFWNCNTKEENGFSLSAVFHAPDGVNAKIADVCFHPWLPVVATASPNGTFKLWREIGFSDASLNASWRCELALEYKGLPCNSICFSNDGSLLGVACGSVLTVWLFEDLLSAEAPSTGSQSVERKSLGLSSPSSVRVELLHVLVHPPSEEPIQSVSFLRSSVPLFVAVTESGVYVWNALTQGIWWSSRARTRPRTLAVDDDSGRFALTVQIPALSFCEDSKGNDQKEEDATDAVHSDKPGPSTKEKDRSVERSRNQDSAMWQVNGEKRLEASKTRQQTKRNRPKSTESSPIYHGNREALTQNYCPTDSAVALFDADSPIPLRVERLAPGLHVAALEFVSSVRAETGATLVCIDSNLDVSLLFSNEEENEVTELSRPSLSVESPAVGAGPSGKIGLLLGSNYGEKEVRDDVSGPRDNSNSKNQDTYNISPTDEWQCPAGEIPIDQAFRTFFDGPIHVQAPVSAKSVDFIRSLLPKANEKTDQLSEVTVEAERQSGQGAQKTSGITRVPPFKTEYHESTPAEFEACRAICKSIMRRYNRLN